MNINFGEKMYNSIVIEGIGTYKKMYENLSDNHDSEYWRNISKFYNKLNDEDKNAFYNIIEMVLEDTTAHVLGILDGVCSLAGGGAFDSEIIIDRENMENDLQESFLVYIDENKKICNDKK